MVCVLEGRGRSKNSNLNAVVVVRMIVVVTVNWTLMTVGRGSENSGQIPRGGRRSPVCWCTEHLV